MWLCLHFIDTKKGGSGQFIFVRCGQFFLHGRSAAKELNGVSAAVSPALVACAFWKLCTTRCYQVPNRLTCSASDEICLVFESLRMNPAAAPCLTRSWRWEVKVEQVWELREENGVAESGGLIDGAAESQSILFGINLSTVLHFFYQPSGQQRSKPLIMHRKSYNMIN